MNTFSWTASNVFQHRDEPLLDGKGQPLVIGLDSRGRWEAKHAGTVLSFDSVWAMVSWLNGICARPQPRLL